LVFFDFCDAVGRRDAMLASPHIYWETQALRLYGRPQKKNKTNFLFMKNFQEQYQQVQELLLLDDWQPALKRCIDFALDSQDIVLYQATQTLVVESTQNNAPEVMRPKIEALLQALHQNLSPKENLMAQNIISIQNLKKEYASSFALGPINLEIHTGEIIGLVGENGNGKTTLLRSICQELGPTAGKIHYHFPHEDLYDLRTKLIYIPQRPETWRGSVYQNLSFAASCYQYSPEENNLVVDLIIYRLGLWEFRQRSWEQLSSGYKMRFELARMLLRKPQVLLIDEPLANLDILAQQTVLDDFRHLANSAFRPMAIVLSSQQLYEVEKTANQVVFLKKGEQKNLNTQATDLDFMVEFHAEIGLSSLREQLQSLGLISIEQTGGTYVASFPSDVDMLQFMRLLLSQNISPNYLRNITHSTRKFFI
jgi:ABC-2 type transport system ATP-binding protein